MVIESVPNQSNDAEPGVDIRWREYMAKVAANNARMRRMEDPSYSAADLADDWPAGYPIPLWILAAKAERDMSASGTAAIAARRLGAHVELPDVLRDRLIRDEWIKRVADAKWFGFFVGATVCSFVWAGGLLILEGWK